MTPVDVECLVLAHEYPTVSIATDAALVDGVNASTGRVEPLTIVVEISGIALRRFSLR